MKSKYLPVRFLQSIFVRMKGFASLGRTKHHHACNIGCKMNTDSESPTGVSVIEESFMDQFEDMGWELPPSSVMDSQLEHYYHYPGVTLGIHRRNEYSINYERVRTSHYGASVERSTEIYKLKVPRMTQEQAVHLQIGREKIIVTMPEIDTAGRFVFVSVLFYRIDTKLTCNCGCHPPVSFSEMVSSACEATAVQKKSSFIKRKVHFAPLVSVRYIKPTVDETIDGV